ncbi:unnamed protein product [Urochloa humidicola]
MEETLEKRYPVASLTDELLVEILSRLPVRSVCRFKCVSRSWRKLISDPGHRKKLPQMLVGFFYQSLNGERFPYVANHFTNVTRKGIPFIYPSFSFLPVRSSDVVLLDCCNGLLLCRCLLPNPRDSDGMRPFLYAVCNPATEKWVMLPVGSSGFRTARLGFDPALSSHFHVIEYVEDEGDYITGVDIYSSKTGSWSSMESKWSDGAMLYNGLKSVFLNGIMHSLVLMNEIVAVDMEGKRWRTIPTPPSEEFGFISQANGCLLYFDEDDNHAYKLSVWILEDYGTDKWVLKHTVSTLFLFGGKKLQFDLDYKVIAVHPECNLIFFVFGWDHTLMAYEMDRREVHVIRNIGHDAWDPYLPYVPFFSESLADKH